MAETQGAGVRASEDHLQRQHAQHLIALGHGNLARAGLLAHFGQQTHQARIVGLASGLQPDQIDPITIANPIYDHNPLTSARLKDRKT
ncbi:hypothetical protein, partial [Methylobacterium radiotolerans]|uniref:hypothetical protein n=1 Tax=Methylobacterium radiotolerans TaxID=31998 RepID=UPI001AEC885D